LPELYAQLAHIIYVPSSAPLRNYWPGAGVSPVGGAGHGLYVSALGATTNCLVCFGLAQIVVITSSRAAVSRTIGLMMAQMHLVWLTEFRKG